MLDPPTRSEGRTCRAIELYQAQLKRLREGPGRSFERAGRAMTMLARTLSGGGEE